MKIEKQNSNKLLNSALNICNVIRCFFGFHKWKLGRLMEFDSPKMDSYGDTGCKMQIRNCERCDKLGAIIVDE